MRRKTIRDRSPTANVTTVLIALFILSAGIRLTAGPLPDLSREIQTTGLSALAAYPERDFAAGSDILIPLIDEIEARKAALSARETAVYEREVQTKELIQGISAQLAELEAAEMRLERMLSVARTAAEMDISQLVSVYEAMKPKDSARIFSEMTPDFAAGFLARMQPEIAARVVAELEPEKAYSISVVLAGRNL